jgi:hypothetical protein
VVPAGAWERLSCADGSRNDSGEPGKKGTRGLWTGLRPAEDI